MRPSSVEDQILQESSASSFTLADRPRTTDTSKDAWYNNQDMPDYTADDDESSTDKSSTDDDEDDNENSSDDDDESYTSRGESSTDTDKDSTDDDESESEELESPSPATLPSRKRGADSFDEEESSNCHRVKLNTPSRKDESQETVIIPLSQLTLSCGKRKADASNDDVPISVHRVKANTARGNDKGRNREVIPLSQFTLPSEKNNTEFSIVNMNLDHHRASRDFTGHSSQSQSPRMDSPDRTMEDVNWPYWFKGQIDYLKTARGRIARAIKDFDQYWDTFKIQMSMWRTHRLREEIWDVEGKAGGIQLDVEEKGGVKQRDRSVSPFFAGYHQNPDGSVSEAHLSSDKGRPIVHPMYSKLPETLARLEKEIERLEQSEMGYGFTALGVSDR
ncbi:hypothetical protein BO71DRAFT_412364 [Aspergillus ellipticus CBS 707.79]|uniref:Uncharacterized protein n=1 Tax=Aspergillus ellipticus CBS 707.79 TaxID=1448320 RepID=A0A319D0C2_9EURO|nr:hypothetical protein BO71DRAFT_412364 [Aspergillus ellipticus CBS 707.79]